MWSICDTLLLREHKELKSGHSRESLFNTQEFVFHGNTGVFGNNLPVPGRYSSNVLFASGFQVTAMLCSKDSVIEIVYF